MGATSMKTVCFVPDMMFLKMFDVIKVSLNKNELRYVMKKFQFPDDKMAELEQTYRGKDKLQDRIYNAMLCWKEFKGLSATIDELIRIFHIIGYVELCNKLKTMKIYSQRLRF